MLISPHFSGNTQPRLYFIENQENFILVADLAQLLEKFFPKMIVSTLALYWFNDNAGNIVGIVVDGLIDLCDCFLLYGYCLADIFCR
ncbi:hypothetical protein D3C80_944360 [compost metagenome]